MTKRHSIFTVATALVGMWVLGACGGQAFTSDPDGGSGGSSSAGSGGSSVGGGGSGGSNVGGGGSGGSNVGGGGSGGSNVGGGGSGGSNVGGGGSGGSPDCPPPSACNWCGGKDVYDDNGCIVGYRCANGADPCWVSPCHDSSGCALDEVCGDDMLCWPAQEPKCGPMSCSSGGGTSGGYGSCSCNWSCNGKKFGFKCKTDDKGITTCDCMPGGIACAEDHSDVLADAGVINPCDDCCGYPKP